MYWIGCLVMLSRLFERKDWLSWASFKGTLMTQSRIDSEKLSSWRSVVEDTRTRGYSEKTKAYVLLDRDKAAVRKRRAILAALEQAKACQREQLVRKAQ